MSMRCLVVLLALITCLGSVIKSRPKAADPPTTPPEAAAAPDVAAREPTPLNKEGTVLLDAANKKLILKANVCLRAGLLEMLLCRSQTKEHEAILTLKSEAYVMHAGLLALGAKVGTPVQYDPEFKAPTGHVIKIMLRWQDAEGRDHSVPAQSWVRRAIYRYYSSPLSQLPSGFTLPKESELRYDPENKELIWFGPMTTAQRDDLLSLSQDAQYRKGIETFFNQSQPRQMEAHWIFAGSGFWVKQDGTKVYQAEEGNVICVANFGDALLDINVPSSASNEGLQFEPWTDRIPPVGTAVEVDLIPVATAEEAAGAVPETMP